MIFRLLELSLSLKEQLGFTLGSFSWDDGTYHSLLGLLYDFEYRYVYFSIAFYGIVICIGGGNEMD